MIDKKQLLESGYTAYPTDDDVNTKKTLYQKCIQGCARSKKFYFINFYIWDFSGYPYVAEDHPVSVDVCMYRLLDDQLEVTTIAVNSSEESFRVQLQIESASTIAYVERFYRDMYYMLNCVPDLHNND